MNNSKHPEAISSANELPQNIRELIARVAKKTKLHKLRALSAHASCCMRSSSSL